jgi:outer membrane receptor protein involved in Fe transport
MPMSTTVLAEVTVEGQKPMIEEMVDRTVYNAENDETNKGGDATTVLAKVPMLSVDLDGNVSLRGSSNIKVLINNKPSTIMASSIPDALKQIPAEMIKSVEVITSPSSRYDAEGSAGIININTKKNTLQGLTLNVNSSAGYRGSNLGLNGNFRRKNWGLSLGGWGRSSYNVKGDFENTQTTINPETSVSTTNKQTSSSLNAGLFGRYNLGFDWDINKKNYVLANASFGVRNNNSKQFDLMQYTNGVLRNSRNTYNDGSSNNIDFNFNYTHIFDKPGHEFSLLAMVSNDSRDNTFSNDILNLSNLDQVSSSIKNINYSFDREATIQADYIVPISKTQSFEMGAKYIYRLSNSDFTSYKNITGNDAGGYLIDPNANLSNVFDYVQNIGAAYSSYTYSTKNKWTFKGGLRYEYTDISASFLKQENAPDLTIPSYSILVPSFNLSKNLPKGTWRFSFNRRIQRPSIRYLNPNIDRTNPLRISTGNPNLDPEYANNFEIGYSRLIKQTYISAAIFHRNTTGSISNISLVDTATINGKLEDIILTKPFNIGSEKRYGMDLNLNVNLANKFRLGGGADIDYVNVSNNDPDPSKVVGNKGFSTRFRAFGSYEIGKGYGFQLFSFYRLKEVNLQGYSGGFGMYNLSFKKDINEKRGSIGIGIENFLQKGIKIVSETQSTYINNKNINMNYNFNIRVNFSYRIGKMTFEEPKRRRKSITNDDQKGGGDDSGQGQQQPQGR